MTDRDIIKTVSEFRKGILGKNFSLGACYMICAPLQSFLSACCEIETSLESIEYSEDTPNQCVNHYWLTLEDGRVIDPTIDQFESGHKNGVYLGDALSGIHFQMEVAGQ